MNWNVDNCPRCGKVFAKNFKSVCPSCLKEIEAEYGKCAAYLREHRGAAMQELSDATGVSIRQITNFIREGRISIADNPNMSYPCELCGAPVRDHTICTDCRNKLTRDINRMTSEEKQEAGNAQATFRISQRLKK